MARAVHTTTDHQEIRRWAEAHGGKPAAVKGTGKKGDPGILRIDFPGFSGERTLRPISWEEFYKWFDANELALLYREDDRFNKLVSRETAETRGKGQRGGRRAGQTKAAPRRRSAASQKRTSTRRSRTAKPRPRPAASAATKKGTSTRRSTKRSTRSR
jgi:hypothetical protein